MNLQRIKNKYLRRFLALTMMPLLFPVDVFLNCCKLGATIFWEYVEMFKIVWGVNE